MINKLIELLWWVFLYVALGIIHLFIKVWTVPFGFIFLDQKNAMYNIFYWPVILLKDFL